MIVSHLQTLVVTFAANIRPYLSGVASVIGNTKRMNDLVGREMNRISSITKSAGEQIKQSTTQAMQSSYAAMNNSFTRMRRLTALNVAEMAREFKNIGTYGPHQNARRTSPRTPLGRAGRGVVTGLESGFNVAKNFFGDESSAGFHELANAFQTIGRYTTSAISRLTSFRGVLSSIRSVASSVYTGMTSLGRSIGVGLYNASSMASRGMSALGTSIASTFRAFPGIVSSAVRSASGYLSSFFTQMSVSIHNAGVSLEEFGHHWIHIGRQVRAFGKLLSLYVTGPLLLMAGASVTAFADFDQAMTETFAKLGKQSPKVRKQMEDMVAAVATSGRVAFSPTELAKGYEELAAAGLDAGQVMATLGPAAQFAQAGAFSLDTSVQMLIGSMSSFGAMSTVPAIFSANMQRFADVMVNVGNTTPASVEEVARAMAQDGAVAARNYGMSLEELAAIIGVYAFQGKKGEEAGHLVGRGIRLMTSSFMKNQDVWKKFGIDLIDKSTGGFIKFADAIKLLETKMQSLSAPMRVSFLSMLGFETLSQKAILPLIGYSDELERQEKLYKEHGSTAEMAKIQMESFSNQMKVFRNVVVLAAIEIGKMLAPYVVALTKVVAKVIAYWRGLSDEIKKTAFAFGLWSGLLGPVLVGLSILMSFSGYIALGLAYIRTAVYGAVIAFTKFGLIGSTFGYAIVLAFQELIARGGGIVQIINNISAAFVEMYNVMLPLLTEIQRMWSFFVQSLATMMVAGLEAITSVFGSGMAWIGQITNMTWSDAISWLAEWLRFARYAMQNFGLVGAYVFVKVQLALTGLWEYMKWVFTSAVPAVMNWFGKNWFNIWTTWSSFVNTVFNNLISNIVSIFTNLPSLLNGTKTLGEIWKPLTEGFVNTISELPKIAPRAVSAAEEALAREVQSIQTQIADGYGNMVADDLEADRLAKEQAKAAKLMEKSIAPAWEGVISEAQLAGMKAGEGIGEGLDLGTKNSKTKAESSVDNVGRWSNEALHRIQAYTEAGGGMRGKVLSTTGSLVEPTAGPNTLTENRLDAARADQANQAKVAMLMQKAVEQLILLNKKKDEQAPVVLGPAVL